MNGLHKPQWTGFVLVCLFFYIEIFQTGQFWTHEPACKNYMNKCVSLNIRRNAGMGRIKGYEKKTEKQSRINRAKLQSQITEAPQR